MKKKYPPMLKLLLKRKESGLSQQQLADKVGVKYNTISAYETGQNFPRRETLDQLASALDCEVKDII